MRIALLGGTGDIGEGLALRFGRDTDHEVLVGSRDPESARDAVAGYEETLEAHGAEATVKGFVNEMVTDRADVAVLAVPPYHVGDTIESVADALDENTILVTPAVAMKRDDGGMQFHPPSAGSTTELVAQRAPDGVPVVGAYHNLPAARLADLEADIDYDTPVVGTDRDAVRTVVDLTNEIEGLRALEAGPLSNAAAIESLTALTITLTMYNDARDLGVKWQE
ncbi:NADPH-dependent F420 reductase [Halopiger xanaduensis]|uniref:NADPH-dependent F420 reductase n=1 Tax=Halopiger xanaduensis (strain DSM 18323 / JCM 14033 / SH-6) TaxID=797210 RepID=F8DAE8_HALXS|nr:NADPH-dependent F420 reductase [Halopiger xanaduensis]AEH38041.1 NADPH-dependent F420 reductase [Halopiger xanaduensis SH-6]